MKNIFQVLIFLLSIASFGCTCDPPAVTDKYIQSDFVARATIVKNFKNEGSEELYEAEIIISELFKGEALKSIYVAGRSDGKIGSSCSIFIPEKTELIIYAHKEANGKFVISMCSGLLYLNGGKSKRINRELSILKLFKEKGITFTDKITYRETGKLYSKLKQFEGIELRKSFAIFQITFATDLTIKKISEISGFDKPINEELIEILKSTTWRSYHKQIENVVPENSRLLIGIYYYGKEKSNPSFLSHFYL